MIRFQPFGQVMSIADTGASAGTTKSWVASCISSRSGMEPGCGKKLHVSKFGARRFIPGCSNEIPGRFRQCILRFHGWRDTSHTTTRRNDGLHPTTRASERANAGAPRVGPTTHGASFKTDKPESQSAAHSNFDRSLSLATLVTGNSIPAWSRITLTMRFKILLWTLIPRLQRWQARIKPLNWSGFYTIE